MDLSKPVGPNPILVRHAEISLAAVKADIESFKQSYDARNQYGEPVKRSRNFEALRAMANYWQNELDKRLAQQ